MREAELYNWNGFSVLCGVHSWGDLFVGTLVHFDLCRCVSGTATDEASLLGAGTCIMISYRVTFEIGSRYLECVR